jgi:hypothetical protein
MAVRFKLDRAGVKLTLRQWSRFTPTDRRELLQQACDSERERAAYRTRLEEFVVLRAGETATPLPEPVVPIWNADSPPDPVVSFARDNGVHPPEAMAWRALSELQRFVLVKLSRANHDNVNFIPAMREFSLLPVPRRDARDRLKGSRRVG